MDCVTAGKGGLVALVLYQDAAFPRREKILQVVKSKQGSGLFVLNPSFCPHPRAPSPWEQGKQKVFISHHQCLGVPSTLAGGSKGISLQQRADRTPVSQDFYILMEIKEIKML